MSTKSKRASSYSKKRLRNLPQYKDMPEEELDEIIENKILNIARHEDFERRIEEQIEEFGDDYDLEDLKINDMLTLRALAQAYIKLEDLENYDYDLRTNTDLKLDDMLDMDKLNNMMSKLRGDISKMQDDLQITKKARKGDTDATVLSELERLKKLAEEFYEERMLYIWCPKCKMLLATIWTLYPEEKTNKITLKCNRKISINDDEFEICGHKFTITTKELLDKRGVNIDEIPEFFK